MQSSPPPQQSTNSPGGDVGNPQIEQQMDQAPPSSYQQRHPDDDAHPEGLHPQAQEPGAAPPSGPNQSQNGSPTANGSLDANGERDAASQGSHSRATTATTTPFDGALKFDPTTNAYRPKMIKVDSNKIYVGNLPVNTREDDLEGCFGEMGRILGVELKVGYGFVEFESREQAERAVQKYDGGLFLGNKIRCEVSHGGGKTAKFAGEPGACFKCRQPGHWARECPNEAVDPNWRDNWKPPHKRHSEYQGRPHPPNNEDLTQQPMRPSAGYRDDYRNEPPSRMPPRDYRPEPFARDVRDYRNPREGRPLSPPMAAARPPYPPREYEDYRGGPPPRGPPAPPPVSTGPYESRGAPPDPRAYDMRPSYESRPPPVYGGSEYDRPPPVSRGGDYGPSSAPPLSAGGYDRNAGPYGSAPYGNGRNRTPPTAFDARRDYGPPSAPSYDPYRGRGPPAPAGPPAGRYDAYSSRRRSMSPPPRSGSGYYDSGPPPAGPPSGYGSNGHYGRSQADYPPAGYYDAPPAGYRGGPPVGPRDDGPDRRYADARMGGYDRR